MSGCRAVAGLDTSGSGLILSRMEASEAWDDAEAIDPDDLLDDDDPEGLPVSDEDLLGIDSDDD
jgi:hypothetical protein